MYIFKNILCVTECFSRCNMGCTLEWRVSFLIYWYEWLNVGEVGVGHIIPINLKKSYTVKIVYLESNLDLYLIYWSTWEFCIVHFSGQGWKLEIWGLVKNLKISYVPLIKTGLEKYKELVTRTSQMEVVLLFYTIRTLF